MAINFTTIGYVFGVNSMYALKANTSALGLFSANRIVSTECKIYQNGTAKHTNSATSGSLNNLNMVIQADNASGGITEYSKRNCAFARIGDGLSDTEESNLSTAVNTFQTTLGRNV